jgi:hypothetical protein
MAGSEVVRPPKFPRTNICLGGEVPVGPLRRIPLLLKRCGFGRIIRSGVLEIIRNPRRVMMAIQIVMDRGGDSRHCFDPDDAQDLAKAKHRFFDLTGAGFTAAVRTGPGQVSRIRSFDPTAEETVFFPRLVGG